MDFRSLGYEPADLVLPVYCALVALAAALVGGGPEASRAVVTHHATIAFGYLAILRVATRLNLPPRLRSTLRLLLLTAAFPLALLPDVGALAGRAGARTFESTLAALDGVLPGAPFGDADLSPALSDALRAAYLAGGLVPLAAGLLLLLRRRTARIEAATLAAATAAGLAFLCHLALPSRDPADLAAGPLSVATDGLASGIVDLLARAPHVSFPGTVIAASVAALPFLGGVSRTVMFALGLVAAVSALAGVLLGLDWVVGNLAGAVLGALVAAGTYPLGRRGSSAEVSS